MQQTKIQPQENGHRNSAAVVAYFGYGSLVNRATHQNAIMGAVPARIKGMARSWRPRPDMPGFPAALLTVFPEKECAVDGLLVYDRIENLPAIDAREARYERVPVLPGEIEILGSAPVACPIYVYQAITTVPPHRQAPKILQSYLDAVMQGFLREFGEDGVRRFISTTRNFDIAIHPDRHKPIYPRAVKLAGDERDLFDTLLGQAGIITLTK